VRLRFVVSFFLYTFDVLILKYKNIMKKIALLLLIACTGCGTIRLAEVDPKSLCVDDKYLHSHQWNEQKYHPIPIDTVTVVAIKGDWVTFKKRGVNIYANKEYFAKCSRAIK
jgi:hypothetical protein